jgi:hypothetical protein
MIDMAGRGQTLALTERWWCPNCKREETIPAVANPHTRFHTCPKFAMLTAPMLPYGTAAKVERKDREDYEGGDAGYTQLDGDGRPVMSIVTTRDEGTDVLVYAPTAHGDIS